MSNLLKDRKSVYGDYLGGTCFRADVMNLIESRHISIHNTTIDAVSKIFIFDIVNKLSRIAVTPNHIDSWEDIAGYATRTLEVLKGEQDADK